MSGGSYDYVYNRIQEIELRNKDNPRRATFQKLLYLVAEAMHDIEWVDSGDCSPGDENKSIDAVFNFLKGDSDTKKKSIAFEAIKNIVSKFD